MNDLVLLKNILFCLNLLTIFYLNPMCRYDYSGYGASTGKVTYVYPGIKFQKTMFEISFSPLSYCQFKLILLLVVCWSQSSFCCYYLTIVSFLSFILKYGINTYRVNPLIVSP